MEKLTRTQRDILGRLTGRDRSAPVRWNDTRGAARVLRGDRLPSDTLAADLKEDPKAVLQVFLQIQD